MDKIIIRHLQVSAAIGILEWELKSRQDILLDIEMVVDTRQIAQTDQIENTIDYARVYENICDYVRDNRFNLIETLANNLANCLIEKFPIQKLKIDVIKPHALPAPTEVSVSVERERA